MKENFYTMTNKIGCISCFPAQQKLQFIPWYNKTNSISHAQQHYRLKYSKSAAGGSSILSQSESFGESIAKITNWNRTPSTYAAHKEIVSNVFSRYCTKSNCSAEKDLDITRHNQEITAKQNSCVWCRKHVVLQLKIRLMELDWNMSISAWTMWNLIHPLTMPYTFRRVSPSCKWNVNKWNCSICEWTTLKRQEHHAKLMNK